MQAAEFALLDPYSTSQEMGGAFPPIYDFAVSGNSDFVAVPEFVKCVNNAPFICFVDGNNMAHLVQGCCNSWTCPRCGQTRAKQEYWRMVNGAAELEASGHKLYMHTLTCLGAELSLAEAEATYGSRTNHFITNCRDRSKAQGSHWTYCQVTERQKRGHPHSHLMSTFLPADAVLKTVRKWSKNRKPVDREVYTSDWYAKRLKTAKLGEQYEITEIRSAKAVATYLGKYLFKDAMFTEWSKGWRRVRYAQSWPEGDERGKAQIAFAIIRREDWRKVDELERTVYADTLETLETARRHLQYRVTYKQSLSVNLEL